MATTTTPKRKAATRTTAKKSTASRRASQTTAATAEKNPVDYAQDVAERAVLVPVGAALTARDAVVELVDSYSSVTAVERQLKKFERRGNTARNQLERTIKRNRTRVQRELRLRRTKAERTIKRNRTRVEREAKAQLRDTRKQVDQLVNTVTERVASAS